MKYLSLFLLFLLIGVGIVFGYSFWKKEKATVVTPVSPKEERFSIESPPKEARTGTVSTMSGQILWESRIATQPAEIRELKQVQQAETLETGKTGQAKVTFADASSVSLSPDSEIEFLQTLPVNFVFRQNKGEINYVKKGIIPLTVRSLHLLMAFSDGEYTLKTDRDTHKIELGIIDGSVKIAYNDINYNTQTLEVTKGQKYLFDDDSRTGEIQ